MPPEQFTNSPLTIGKTEGSQTDLRIFTDAALRKSILKYGRPLAEHAHDNGFETIVYLHTSAQPVYYIVDAFWDRLYSAEQKPKVLFLNSGKKMLREKYSPRHGDSITIDKDGNKSSQFVGIFDRTKNIERFKKNIRSDIKTLSDIKNTLGDEADNHLINKNVVIIDDCEFEGVQRLFAETVIETLYHPHKLEYKALSSYAEEVGSLPTGLVKNTDLTGWAATVSTDPEEIKAAEATRLEIIRLINSSIIT